MMYVVIEFNFDDEILVFFPEQKKREAMDLFIDNKQDFNEEYGTGGVLIQIDVNIGGEFIAGRDFKAMSGISILGEYDCNTEECTDCKCVRLYN